VLKLGRLFSAWGVIAFQNKLRTLANNKTPSTATLLKYLDDKEAVSQIYLDKGRIFSEELATDNTGFAIMDSAAEAEQISSDEETEAAATGV